MDAALINQVLWGFGGALLGAVIFSAVGLVAGTSETATVGTSTLLVVFLGFPPIFIFTFCLAGLVAKHLIHSIPTALLGVPGDTLAVPLLEPCSTLRHFGLPHIALRKMISAGVIASFLSIPISVGFAMVLAPYAELVKAWSGPIFTVVTIGLSYSSAGRWGSIFLILPFAFFVQALNRVAIAQTGHGVMICVFLGMAMGPLFVDLLAVLSPVTRGRAYTSEPKTFWIAPDLKTWSGYFPNPFKILTRKQLLYTLYTTVFSAVTFASSSVGITVLTGEIVQARVKSFYEKLTTSVAIMNAATEATYLCEILIPLVAFGLPLSAVAMGAGFALFNAPPIFTSSPVVHNLHNLLTPIQFLWGGLLAVSVAAVIAYPLAMNYARKASVWAMRNISQESLLAMFSGLLVVLSYFEADGLGVVMAVLVGLISGIMSKYFGFNLGAQYMAYFAAPWIVLQLIGMK
ncbi:MAG: tripartite tricarboxylate transporter permease [Negativicutes bacterium]|nr:tripartite tricarboxylate transporter permease [Negativicutes bacterium]